MFGSRQVRGSDDSAWTIERHWAPRPRWMKSFKARAQRRRQRRKREGRGGEGWDFLDFFNFGDDALAPVILGILLIVGVFLVIWFGWPFFVFLFDTLLFLPLALLTILSRVILRRPWTLEAATTDPAGAARSVVWNVTGWRASAEALERMAQMIRSRGEPSDVPPATPAAHRRARR